MRAAGAPTGVCGRRWNADPTRRAARASALRRLALALFAVVFGSTFACFADVPVSINYVGHIEGDAMKGDEKVMLMVFRLYDGPGTGKTIEKKTALWGRQVSVTLTDGDFDVDLKDTLGSQIADTAHVSLADAITEALADGSSDLYLGLTPASDQNAEIFPRQRLTAIPKVLQARAVRTIPSDFSSVNGTFTTDGPLTVVGSSHLAGDASYGTAKFGTKSVPSFRGGVDVKGTLRADSVSATTLKADAIAARAADTGGSGTLSVSDRLDAAGAVTWNGKLEGSVLTASVARVEGPAQTPLLDVKTLVASNFINNSSSSPIYRHTGSWRLVGSWQTVERSEYGEVAEAHNMLIYDPRRNIKSSYSSISAGSWVAPADCLALFQTYIYNAKANDPACVQFYIITDPKFDAFNTVEPNGVAMLSNGSAGTLEYPVPLLLRKGQLVKWLCYNNNQNDTLGIKETEQTKVNSISYQPFGW